MPNDPSPPEPADLARIRAAFPALESGIVFLENAGGSQVPAVVVERMAAYMVASYVQLGAGYPRSEEATRTVEAAHAFVSDFVNAGRGRVILGPSSSQLCLMLANAYGDVLGANRSIVVAENGHEANIGPWIRMAERIGAEIRWWRIDPDTFTMSLDALESLVDTSTAIVAVPHVSNLLGDVLDVTRAAAIAHSCGARIVVDGVAFAPHRAIDVAAWDVDWYVYSTYKVYGPHMAALYGREDALSDVTGPNHFFIPVDDVPYKFELGGACHEGCAGILGLADYLALLAPDAASMRDRVVRAFEVMTAYERPLVDSLIGFLAARPDVRVIGSTRVDDSRVPTISFQHDRRSSADIARAVNEAGFGIRSGHMYAYRLCRALGIDVEDGVVRISAVHYNTPAEVDRLTRVLADVLGGP